MFFCQSVNPRSPAGGSIRHYIGALYFGWPNQPSSPEEGRPRYRTFKKHSTLCRFSSAFKFFIFQMLLPLWLKRVRQGSFFTQSETSTRKMTYNGRSGKLSTAEIEEIIWPMPSWKGQTEYHN